MTSSCPTIRSSDLESFDYVNALGRPHRDRRRAVLSEQRVDRAIDDLDRHREQREVEPGPEPADDEHHFRRDEQDHAIAQMELDHRRVIAEIGRATSELQSLMRISYAVFCLKKKKQN